MKIKLNDNQCLKGATSDNHTLATYDDGSGHLYITRNSMGLTGIIRADSWEDAYSIDDDEFQPTADPDDCKLSEDASEDEQNAWQEAYGFRPSGPNHTEGDRGIFARDLNGDHLDALTQEHMDQYGIKLEVTTDWESIVQECKEHDTTDQHGIYIPQVFCENITDDALAAQDDVTQQAILALMYDSPEQESYWEDWTTVLDNYSYQGQTLHQDGNLWLINTEEVEKLTSYYGIEDEDVVTNLFGG